MFQSLVLETLPPVVVLVSLSPTEGQCRCSVVEKTLVLGFGTSLGVSIDKK
jgi:hypothetical protein